VSWRPEDRRRGPRLKVRDRERISAAKTALAIALLDWEEGRTRPRPVVDAVERLMRAEKILR
jgi:hypothetical protein